MKKQHISFQHSKKTLYLYLSRNISLASCLLLLICYIFIFTSAFLPCKTAWAEDNLSIFENIDSHGQDLMIKSSRNTVDSLDIAEKSKKNGENSKLNPVSPSSLDHLGKSKNKCEIYVQDIKKGEKTLLKIKKNKKKYFSNLILEIHDIWHEKTLNYNPENRVLLSISTQKFPTQKIFYGWISSREKSLQLLNFENYLLFLKKS